MSTEIFRILFLAGAVIVSFSISTINLHSYDVPIAVILFIALFLTKKIMLPKGNLWQMIEACVFTLITLFTVLTTGSVNSPFFFLIYFLIFSLSLMFEPIVSFSTSMIIILLFILSSPSDLPFKSVIPIFSLAFLSPFALLLSQERLATEKLKENTFLFLSLTLKKHLISIKELLENLKEETEAQAIKKQVNIIEKLIEKYEEQ